MSTVSSMLFSVYTANGSSRGPASGSQPFRGSFVATTVPSGRKLSPGREPHSSSRWRPELPSSAGSPNRNVRLRVSMILLVEDDPDHEALAIRALRKANVANEIQVAHDGVEALDYLNQVSTGAKPMPQLVLLDLKLPKVDGLEVLRNIRATDKTALLPVVVLTSSDEERDIVSSYRLGVNSYIRKPVNFTDFAEATRQLGMYWLLLNQCPPPQ